jgi:hypothetical protein
MDSLRTSGIPLPAKGDFSFSDCIFLNFVRAGDDEVTMVCRTVTLGRTWEKEVIAATNAGNLWRAAPEDPDLVMQMQ